MRMSDLILLAVRRKKRWRQHKNGKSLSARQPLHALKVFLSYKAKEFAWNSSKETETVRGGEAKAGPTCTWPARTSRDSRRLEVRVAF